MSVSNKNKHLTAQERIIIANALTNGSSKQAIAQVLGKHKSTIGKEIKLHRQVTYKCKLPCECTTYKHCTYGRQCLIDCVDFIQFKCNRRDRSPGTCDGCSNYSHCRFTKFRYQPDLAHKEYESLLVSCRSGINSTFNEIKMLGEQIRPLLLQGHSVYQILRNNPDIQLTERTLYSYIENGVFKDAGIDIDAFLLRRTVNRKPPKKASNSFKKREERAFLKGRTYKDYLSFKEDQPNLNIVEMDTVYNDVVNGPFLQTFKFIKYGFLFAIFHEEKTAKAMKEGIDLLESILTPAIFRKEVEALLTDRGTEFSLADEIEQTQGESRRTYLFYCDPMCSHQKGSIENNHTQLRYILPKETDLRAIGLCDQSSLNLALSHINSFPKEHLNNRSAIETLKFFNSEFTEKLNKFGIKPITPNSVILKPHLLKN